MVLFLFMNVPSSSLCIWQRLKESGLILFQALTFYFHDCRPSKIADDCFHLFSKLKLSPVWVYRLDLKTTLKQSLTILN